MRQFFVALTFLTVLPVSSRFFNKPIKLADGAAFFPLVGALLGIFFGGLFLIGELLIPTGPLVVLLFLFAFIITRGLHIDGLADTADGVVGGMNPERAMTIMRTGDVGPVGMFTVVMIYLFKYASMIALATSFLPLAFFGMFLSGRWNMVLVGSAFGPAREDGLGSQFIRGLTWKHSAGASLAGLLIVGLLTWWMPEFFLPLLSGILTAFICGWVLAFFVARHLRGLTGDVLGAVNEVSEAGFLLGLLLWSQFFPLLTSG
ncbi:MAG: adenosylcobinamide-GDP ribazoletransferase [Bacillota bacterium]|nr:adenosylcobinamide-GDP ribazoletransferase [Bacillota bacterium]